MVDTFFSAKDISKEFSGKRVLDGVNVSLTEGEVLGLIGENGAGKSTLLKIISGIYQPTEGEILIEGRPFDIASPLVARRLGITMIPQEFNLVDTLRVYENVFLGQEQTLGPILKRRDMIASTRELLQELNADISPTRVTRSLSVAQKQMVEIAKALVHESRLLIMDEPTTAVTEREIEVLFRVIRDLSEKGVTVIFVSHKLGEIKELCERVLVLRDGKQVGLDETCHLNERKMAEMMVGRELSEVFPNKVPSMQQTKLEVKSLSVRGVIHDISFDVKKGEILGIAGLVGAGRTELAEAIVGLRKKSAGEIYIDGERCRIKKLADAVRHGLAYLSEDRQGKGILRGFALPANISLISLAQYSRWGFVDKTSERASAQEHVEKFNIRAPSLGAKLRYLSGGNQQKAYLAKWMDTEPRILILDEPTRGIDVQAKREIYRFIHDLTNSGIGCVVISSELEEIIGMCGRVLVMREGKAAGILDSDKISEEQIMYLATGVEGATVSGGSYNVD
ncbi:MAG: sugar ABC transporter ATP-binding protein [Planctomycetes bacterium]|nr:sugar ABC transporter ATP-binding protein [Planctomycetota bacterium]